MAFMGDEEDDLDLGPPPPALDRLPPPPPGGGFAGGMADLRAAKGAPDWAGLREKFGGGGAMAKGPLPEGDAPPIAPGEGGPMRRRRRRFGSNRMPQMLGQATVAPGTPDVTPYMERLKSLFGTYGGL